MSRGEERRRSRDKGGSDMTRFYLILGTITVLGVGAISWVVGGNVLGTAVSDPIEVEGLDDMQVLAELAQGVSSGDTAAAVTIIEFGDYQCPGCGGFALSVKPQLDLTFVQTGRAQFVFYDFPLIAIHAHAFLAARAARCAGDEGQYWEYHQQLFRNQSSWSGRQSAVGAFLGYGEALGFDQDAFEGCLKSDKYADVVTANMRLGAELGISGTPTVLIEAQGQLRPVIGVDFQSIEEAIESVLEDVGAARD